MKKLSPIDKAFLLGESREMPMHVAGVSLFTLPEGADEREFLHSLAANMRDTDELLPPFGEHLKSGRLGLLGDTYWEPDSALDLDYHVRHSALPKPGRYRELFTLVSRLHGTLLERSRPLWEMHLIEGLQNRQFAVYQKTHHAAVDGARSVHVSRNMLSSDPTAIREDSPLSLKSWQQYKANLRAGHKREYAEADLRNVADVLKSTLKSSANIYQALQGLTRAWAGRNGDLTLPYREVPRSSLNHKIDGARRFVAQSWPFARIRAVGKAYDGTFNDAVLAMCAGGLRKYMTIHSELPEASLKAMVPVSLRQEGDVDSGNAVAAISADLATDLADPAERMRAIQASVQAGKEQFSGLTPAEIELMTMVMQLPTMVLMPLGLITKLPPYNLTISNVPGIRETMYWNGARLDGSYPLSIVTDGMAMNITLVTYGESVDFGIIACRRSVPQVQRLIDYMDEALEELEEAAGLTTGAPARAPVNAARPARTKAVTKPKTKAKIKAKTKAKKNKTAKAPRKAKTKTKTKTKTKVTPRTAAKSLTKALPKAKPKRAATA